MSYQDIINRFANYGNNFRLSLKRSIVFLNKNCLIFFEIEVYSFYFK